MRKKGSANDFLPKVELKYHHFCRWNGEKRKRRKKNKK